MQPDGSRAKVGIGIGASAAIAPRGTRVLASFLAGFAILAAAASVTVSTAGATGAPRAAFKGTSALSVRLQAISRPGFRARAASAMLGSLGLGGTGPGGLEIDGTGRVLVTARVSGVSAAALASIRASGATITFVDRAQREVTAWIRPSSLDALAAVPGTQYVAEVLAPLSNAVCRTGSYVSEGDTQLNAAAARAKYHVDGRGVLVGVLSDSFNHLGGAASDVAAAELPGAANPCGDKTPVGVLQDAGTTDEGRAMAQIIHDLAPGAAIDFATGHGGQDQFASNIRALAAAGAKVIVDDVTYLDEPLYQQGVVGAAIDAVAAKGVSYFVSAGNFNVILGGKDVSSYEATAFRPMSCPPAVAAADGGAGSLRCHQFSTSGSPSATDQLTFGTSGLFQVELGWNQPMYGVTTDFDLALVNKSTGTVTSLANSNNLKSQMPTEVLSTNVTPGTYSLVVIRYAGSATPRFKLLMYRGTALSAVQYATSTATTTVGPTLAGHVAATGAISVGAVPYDNASTAETYSARGPSLACWAPVSGTTPSAALSPCQYKQVDVAATTGVQNSFFGSGPLHRFYGTSASAPHAAAIAALQLEYRPCTTPALVRAAQAASGRKVGAFGADAVGSGLIDALAALPDTRCAQYISFKALSSRPLGTAPFRVAPFASSSSRLAVRFASSTKKVCTIGAATRVTLRSTGTCRIVASQPGSALFAPAPTVARTFVVRARA